MPEMPIKERIDNFKEVELGFTEEQAINEAKRCLECGCQVNETCALREYASDYLIEHIILSGDQNRHQSMIATHLSDVIIINASIVDDVLEYALKYKVLAF